MARVATQVLERPSRAAEWAKQAGTVIGASLVSGVFLFLQRRILIGISRNVEYDLRQDFYAHLVDQPLSFFHEHRIGDLMARATNDLAAVRQLAGPMIMYTLQTIFVVVLILPMEQPSKSGRQNRDRGGDYENEEPRP